MNIRVLLVDLVAAQVVHDETATAGTIFARTNSPDGNPWNAATSQQKVSTLERMVADEVRQLMPTLFENKK